MENQWFQEWQTALYAEIASVKERSSHGVRTTDGTILFQQNGQTIVQYRIERSARLQEGSPITLHLAPPARGTLISNTDHHVVLELDEEREEIDESSVFTLEPWRLLERLAEKLVEAEEDTHKKQRITRTISAAQPAFHPEGKATSTLHELFLRSIYNHVTFLWGPPGTGKTYTLARLAAAHYLKGKKVLLLSHSNKAIDVVMHELATFLQAENKWTGEGIIRYGNASEALNAIPGLLPESQLMMQHPDLAEKLQKGDVRRTKLSGRLRKQRKAEDFGRLQRLEEKLSLLKLKWNEKERDLVAKSSVVGTTLTKAMLDDTVEKMEVDLVIIDEASMASVPQIAYAATLAHHVVVCGDFKQLPSVTTSYHPLVKKWLSEDVFYHAGIPAVVEKNEWHPHLMMLREQRRMHPAISAFTNRYVYNRYVTDHPSMETARYPIAQKAPFPGEALKMISSGCFSYPSAVDQNGSRFHLVSALIALSLMLHAAKDGIASIGYITPYRAQAKLMEELLSILWDEPCDVQAATIHRFQGAESDAILFDAVDHDRTPGRLLTGEHQQRLMNVAVTRARGLFIHIQNEEIVARSCRPANALRQLQQNSRSLQAVASAEEVTAHLLTRHHKQLTWHETGTSGAFARDLARAESIVITSAAMKMPYVKQTSDKHQVTKMDHSMPLVLLDEQIAWVLCETGKKSFPSARIVSKKVVKYFSKQFVI